MENVADSLAVFEPSIAGNAIESRYADVISEHFKRLLDRGTFLAVEDKLLELRTSAADVGKS